MISDSKISSPLLILLSESPQSSFSQTQCDYTLRQAELAVQRRAKQAHSSASLSSLTETLLLKVVLHHLTAA